MNRSWGGGLSNFTSTLRCANRTTPCAARTLIRSTEHFFSLYWVFGQSLRMRFPSHWENHNRRLYQISRTVHPAKIGNCQRTVSLGANFFSWPDIPSSFSFSPRSSRGTDELTSQSGTPSTDEGDELVMQSIICGPTANGHAPPPFHPGISLTFRNVQSVLLGMKAASRAMRCDASDSGVDWVTALASLQQ